MSHNLHKLLVKLQLLEANLRKKLTKKLPKKVGIWVEKLPKGNKSEGLEAESLHFLR